MALEVLLWALILTISIVFTRKYFQQQKKKLPPSPPALPILGHLHILKPPAHSALQHLSIKYGPIIFLHIGNHPTLVVSSPSIVEECFTKNDITFANRPRTHAAKILGYNYKTVGFAPYGVLWRNLRRFATIEIFSSARLNHFSPIRTEEVRFIAKKLHSSCNGSRTVNLKSLFLELGFNVIMKMVAGKQWPLPTYMFSADLPTDSSEYIPILKWFGLGKKYRKMVENLHRKYDEFVQDLIDESRRNEGGSGSSSPNQRETIIQSLLSSQEAEPEFYTEDTIKANIQVIKT